LKGREHRLLVFLAISSSAAVSSGSWTGETIPIGGVRSEVGGMNADCGEGMERAIELGKGRDPMDVAGDMTGVTMLAAAGERRIPFSRNMLVAASNGDLYIAAFEASLLDLLNLHKWHKKGATDAAGTRPHYRAGLLHYLTTHHMVSELRADYVFPH